MEEKDTQNKKGEHAKCEEERVECEKKRDEYLDGWKRAKADFINYKKDEIARLSEIAKYGTEDMIMELVGVLDNFDLGLASLEKQGVAEKGMYMIRANLADVLKRRGVERIDADIGKPLDPAIAEAISEKESSEPPGTVLQQIEPGYKLHEKLIRPARVKVAKQKSNQ